MIAKIKRLYGILNSLPNRFSRLEQAVMEQKMLSAQTLINTFDYSLDLPISNYEFKVFSQWGDDGIIQYLIKRTEITDTTFIEFGVENYQEANTRFLLLNNNWTGLIMDSSKENLKEVQNSQIYWKFNLTTRDAFITRENINGLIQENGFLGDIGLLSIDIDGNDYWIWEAISVVYPVIVVAEYNSVFGRNKTWTVPYKADFSRTKEHYSNLYFGSSLQSLCDLAEQKGYFFVGCSNSGNNAYFVRKDRIGHVKPVEPGQGYVLSSFRESRNEQGYLSYISGNARIDLLRGMPVFNTRTGQMETI